MAKKKKAPKDDDSVPEEEIAGKPKSNKVDNKELEDLDEEDMKRILQNHEMRLRKIEYHLRI